MYNTPWSVPQTIHTNAMDFPWSVPWSYFGILHCFCYIYHGKSMAHSSCETQRTNAAGPHARKVHSNTLSTFLA